MLHSNCLDRDLWLPALLAAILLTTALQSIPADAAFRNCALRSGPQGPCTCRTDGDGPGEYTEVSASYCRKATPKASKAGGAAAIPSQGAAPLATATTPRTETATAQPPAPQTVAGARKLDEVRSRGKLLCGVNPGLIGFAHPTQNGTWAGIDVDFCRAVAVAVLGDASLAEFVPLDAASRFDALRTGKVDLLSRNTTWTMSRDVDLGLEFVGVIYFDGQSFMAHEDRGLVSAQQLAGLKVCVQSATTSEKNMAYYFSSQRLSAQPTTFGSREDLVRAYRDGQCDAYSADRSSLYSDRAGFAEPLKHAILPEVISKEPLGPAVLQGDQEWVEIVRWVLAGLVNAEETGLDRATASSGAALKGDAMRLVEGAGESGERLRLQKNWLKNVVSAVGNYGEMFDANIGAGSPLGMSRGINALWKKGGILYAPPMW